jgi:hypothetical protein
MTTLDGTVENGPWHVQVGYGANMGKSVSVCIRTRTDTGMDTDLVIRGSMGIRSMDTNQEISQNG